ncbi:hypothetical protein AB9M75_06070 [Lactobacillus sp. AN1001]
MNWLMTNWANLQTYVINSLYINGDVGGKTAQLIDNVAKGFRIAFFAAFAAAIMWGAGLYGVGGDESVRAGKKRWKQAAVAIVVTAAAWFFMEWLKTQAEQTLV